MPWKWGDVSNFEILLASIAERPGLYVGEVTLLSVADYLQGFSDALGVVTGDHPLYGWSHWIAARFRTTYTPIHWTRILLEEYGSDGAALQALPELYAQFSAERVKCAHPYRSKMLDMNLTIETEREENGR